MKDSEYKRRLIQKAEQRRDELIRKLKKEAWEKFIRFLLKHNRVYKN